LPNYILNCIWFILCQCFEWCKTIAKTNDVRLLAPLQTTGDETYPALEQAKEKYQLKTEDQQSSTVRSRWIHMLTPLYAVPIA
jgi:hypothetical protein